MVSDANQAGVPGWGTRLGYQAGVSGRGIRQGHQAGASSWGIRQGRFSDHYRRIFPRLGAPGLPRGWARDAARLPGDCLGIAWGVVWLKRGNRAAFPFPHHRRGMVMGRRQEPPCAAVHRGHDVVRFSDSPRHPCNRLIGGRYRMKLIPRRHGASAYTLHMLRCRRPMRTR
jgi:hypothetical protein